MSQTGKGEKTRRKGMKKLVEEERGEVRRKQINVKKRHMKEIRRESRK